MAAKTGPDQTQHLKSQSSIWVSYVGGRYQALGPSSAAVPGALAVSWIGCGEAEIGKAPRWDADVIQVTYHAMLQEQLQ